MKPALDGITILDLSQGWAGPGGAMLLAEQGADVIKVEPPQGDQARAFFAYPPIRGCDRSFLVMNRSKRAIVLNLKEDAAKKILYRLIERADVLLHNFRPGVAERLGIHYETAKEHNPQLVYVSLTPFGKKGPYADQPAYDMVIQALTGALYRQLPDGTPLVPGLWISDCSGAIMLGYAISLALLARERTGLGQEVDLALFNQALTMQIPDLVRGKDEVAGEDEEELFLVEFLSPYRCRDGKYVVHAAMTNHQWEGLCRALGRDDLLDDPSYDAPLKRARKGDILHDEMAKAFVQRPRDEWLEPLTQGDVPHAPVLSREEVFDHPQALENDMIVEMDHPAAGRVKMLGMPFRLAETPGAIRGPSPLLGQHTKEVLRELGYNDSEIETWREKGVIGIATP
jgi:crotonobetainyl-CoA:carnitine CoA-transferase CaiB-like acyl-CoA transferase